MYPHNRYNSRECKIKVNWLLIGYEHSTVYHESPNWHNIIVTIIAKTNCLHVFALVKWGKLTTRNCCQRLRLLIYELCTVALSQINISSDSILHQNCMQSIRSRWPIWLAKQGNLPVVYSSNLHILRRILATCAKQRCFSKPSLHIIAKCSHCGRRNLYWLNNNRWIDKNRIKGSVWKWPSRQGKGFSISGVLSGFNGLSTSFTISQIKKQCASIKMHHTVNAPCKIKEGKYLSWIIPVLMQEWWSLQHC